VAGLGLNVSFLGERINRFLPITESVEDVDQQNRMKRRLGLIENMTMGRKAVGYLTESLHGAGSPQAQRVQIRRESDLEGKKALAKRLAGIPEY
jgi:4-hydroxybutyryl-CoA dehydratase/vinylacetyl-CoA-Delta-isomerase